MAKLENNVSTPIGAGTHNVQVVIGTGTALLQYSTDSLSFIEIPTTSVSASIGFELELPSCAVKAILTGDAELAINYVKR